MNTIEQLRTWSGGNFEVAPWPDVAVPGLELYRLSNDKTQRGVAVAPGVADPLAGPAGFAAARERGVSDAAALASLALFFLARGGTPFRSAADAYEQPAGVAALIRAPVIEGNTLEFWGWDGDLATRFQVDLTSHELRRAAGSALVTAQQDPIDLARRALAGPSDTMYRGAIDALVTRAGDPRAAATLNDTIRGHRNAEARAWAAACAARLHDAATVPALIHALGHDAAAPVRKAAADALGKLGAADARAALEQARGDADLDVRGAVGRALALVP